MTKRRLEKGVLRIGRFVFVFFDMGLLFTVDLHTRTILESNNQRQIDNPDTCLSVKQLNKSKTSTNAGSMTQRLWIQGI